MTDQASPPLHPLFVQGVELFNAGDFFACHEVLEDLWNEQTGPEKRLTQAIIQIAVAYYHLGRNNPEGAGRLFIRAMNKLDDEVLSCPLAARINTAEFVNVARQHCQNLKIVGSSSQSPADMVPPRLRII